MNKNSIIIILTIVSLILLILVIKKPKYSPSPEEISNIISNITVTNLEVNIPEDDLYPTVNIKGELPNDCISVKDTSINLINNIFYINLNTEQTKTICHKREYPFSLTVPIDTTGLTKGTYHAKVGDKETEFELTQDTLKIEELKNDKLPTD